MDLFRLYDLRGVYPTDINNRVAKKIGKALGSFLKGKTVAVGRDTRFSSRRIFNSFISGLRSSSTGIISLGVVPNPVNYFYAFKHRIFGAYVTASHNPAEYTGFKFIKPNGTSFVKEISKLKRFFETEHFTNRNGDIKKADALLEYKNFLKKNFEGLKGKIVVENFGGVGILAEDIFESLGLEVISLHRKINETFFGMKPEPNEKNLQKLAKAVKERKANFGIAFDGDADRSVFVDDKGNVLNGSVTSAVFISEILKRKKGKIILTADCASELNDLVRRYGGKIIWWRVGHGFIEEKLIKESALFAGEQSSHFYFNEFYPFSDGILATAYLAKILGGKKLSELTDKIKLHPIDKFYIDVKSDELKRKIIQFVRSEHPKALDIMDGIKMKLNEIEWIIIRSSQTLPEINICIQAKNKKRLNELKRKYTNYVVKKFKEIKK